MADYGLPGDAAVNYGAPGFPPWVDELCRRWNLDSSTYPNHQTGDRPDIGAAPNPQRLNRGIDWAGDPQAMLDFARWLVSIGPNRTPGAYGPPGLEMVIYQDPRTGERVGYPPFVDYGGDYSGHTDHVHTRQSAALIDMAAAPLSRKDRYALDIIGEGRRRGITRRGICIALATALVESNLTMYANDTVPESMGIPHDAVGRDYDSVGLFQQRCPMWGPANVLMDPAASAGLFYDHLVRLDYNNEARSPGSYAQAVQRSAFPDRYDQRWAEAVQLYDRLAGAPPAEEIEDWMSNPELERMIRELHGAMFNENPSLSRYADERTWPVHRYIRATDGHVFDLIVEHNAALGDAWSLNAVRAAAARGDQIAAAFLDRLTTGPTTAPPPPPPAPPSATPDISPAPPQVNAAPPPPPAPTGRHAAPPSDASFAAAVDQFGAQLEQLTTTLKRLIG